MRPRRISLLLLAVVLALVLLPTVVLWPRGGTVAAGGVLGSGWSWGDDGSRQLGNGAPNDGNFVNMPVQVGPVGSQLTNIIAVAGGTSHSLALRTNGIVLAWGSDSQGQLGDGAPNDGGTSNVPVSVSGLTNVVAIAAGGQHSLALKRDGTVWAWGNDGSRQLGNGAPNDGASSNVPVQVVGVGGSGSLASIIAIAAGGSHSLALRSNGTVVSWGDDF
jgi:Regulator of chromosome condensation (RCC1) repeat